jgi:hypothetical protein
VTGASARIELLVTADDPESDFGKVLAEIDAMSEFDPLRKRLIAGIAQWWAQKLIEEAAISEDYDRRETARRERARATRAARKP